MAHIPEDDIKLTAGTFLPPLGAWTIRLYSLATILALLLSILPLTAGILP